MCFSQTNGYITILIPYWWASFVTMFPLLFPLFHLIPLNASTSSSVGKIYIYIHTIASWKNFVAVEMVNRPLGLVFRFSKPSHHLSRAHLFKRTEGYDRHVTRRRLNNLEDKGKRRGMKTVSYFLLDFLANRFKEIPTRGLKISFSIATAPIKPIQINSLY